MNDWMIDIETTGLRPDRAAILSLGSVAFDRRTFTPGAARYWSMRMLEGRAWDAETMDWWSKQSPEAFAKATDEAGRVAVADALVELAEAVGPEAVFWAKPTHFDFPFVQGYFAEVGIKSPFHHRRVLDVRSWIASRGEEALARQAAHEAKPFSGLAHTPVDDCLNQIQMLKEACV